MKLSEKSLEKCYWKWGQSGQPPLLFSNMPRGITLAKEQWHMFRNDHSEYEWLRVFGCQKSWWYMCGAQSSLSNIKKAPTEKVRTYKKLCVLKSYFFYFIIVTCFAVSTKSLGICYFSSSEVESPKVSLWWWGQKWVKASFSSIQG